MPLELRPCTTLDYPQAVAVEKAAWAGNPFSPILFPGPFPSDIEEFRVQEMAKHVQEDPANVWLKVVDTDAEQPDLGVGFAKWQVYNDKLPGPRQNKKFGQGCNVELCNQLFGALGMFREKYVGDKHCVFLQILATHPDHQRRGIGEMLVRWGTRKADEYGIPAYLESSPGAHNLYLRCGFRDLERHDLDMSEYGAPDLHRTWIMWYEKE